MYKVSLQLAVNTNPPSLNVQNRNTFEHWIYFLQFFAIFDRMHRKHTDDIVPCVRDCRHSTAVRLTRMAQATWVVPLQDRIYKLIAKEVVKSITKLSNILLLLWLREYHILLDRLCAFPAWYSRNLVRNHADSSSSDASSGYLTSHTISKARRFSQCTLWSARSFGFPNG